MRYIDIHPHVISPDLERYTVDPLGGKRSGWSLERPIDTDELIVAMDATGIEKAALVQSSTTYGYDNSYCADSCDRFPHRLSGVCSVNFLSDSAPSDLQYWIHDRGFVGCRLFTTGSTTAEQGDWLDDPRTDPAWSFIEEHQIPVAIQMQSSGIPQLERVLAKHPDIIVVLDHGARPILDGGPPYHASDAIFALSEHQNIYIKMTSFTMMRAVGTPFGAAPLVRAFCDHFGADRMAWGSNLPASEGTMEGFIQLAHEGVSLLNDKEQEAFFHGTAEKIYPKLQLEEIA